MLQFLPIAMMALQAMSAANAAKTAAKGHVNTDAENAQIQAMANRDRLLQAVTNPDDNITKNITAQESGQLRNNFQTSLTNLLNANRRAQLMGRQTYFNPERQDESISQFINKNTDALNATARSNALQRIQAAANGYQSTASGYGGMIPNQQQAQATNNAAMPALLSAGSSILGMFNGSGSGGSMSNIFSQMSSNNNTNLGTQMPWLNSTG